MGDSKVVDSMILDGLWCAFDMVHMGEGSDNVNTRLGLTREEQDEWSAQSHERAAAAAKDGKFAEEITPAEVPQRKGDPVIVDADEGIRPGTTAESLSGLRPAFNKEGTITAGNASQISDGSAAAIVMSKERADALGLSPIAEIISYGMVAGPDSSLHSQPSRAINQALDKAGMSVGDLDLIEINEAFAAVAIQSAKDLGVPVTSSMSTVELLPSATRLGPADAELSLPSPRNSAGAAGVPVLQGSAAVAGRETRSSSRLSDFGTR